MDQQQNNLKVRLINHHLEITLKDPLYYPSTIDSTSFNAVDALPTGHANRQQSVGYNLQHEFETLTANLDLDLTSPSRSITQSAPPPQQSVDAQLQQEPKQLLSSGSSAQSSKPALVAPSASRYEPRLRSELLGKTASSLLGETSAGGLSPAQQFTSLNPQLDSLLNKSSSNLVGSLPLVTHFYRVI